jgi:hypothetical protein
MYLHIRIYIYYDDEILYIYIIYIYGVYIYSMSYERSLPSGRIVQFSVAKGLEATCRGQGLGFSRVAVQVSGELG